VAALRRAGEGSVYQLKVTLSGSEPPIWRRVQVPGDISLARLHAVLQLAMGWHNSHLHQFSVGDTRYGEPDPAVAELEFRNERTAKLNQVAPNANDRFIYEYDFGDSWEHEIVVEATVPPEPVARYPVCTGGERACPPEDCGGFWGYAELLEAVQDPEHPNHEEMLDWLEGDFDPEAFDLNEVNRRLRNLR
jgi:pRiA4b ORF-3-like protein